MSEVPCSRAFATDSAGVLQVGMVRQLAIAIPHVQREKGTPFVKWVGGKRELLPALLPHAPTSFGTYFEPFVGGGALFFNMAPRRAILGDSNERLIRAYRGVKADVDRVITLLKSYPHTKKFYLELRTKDVDAGTDAEVAAWLIYLNKTGYNGLYRVNSKNIFNVPHGDYAKPNICDEPTLRACSRALAGTTLRHDDFEAITTTAVGGDFVYFDPPYVPRSISSYFTSYTASGFGFREQERLRDVALRLKRRGVHVLVSNSATEFVERLYSPHFELIPVLAKRRVNRDGDGRGAIAEYLIK
jgi:DNA adenine methylase